METHLSIQGLNSRQKQSRRELPSVQQVGESPEGVAPTPCTWPNFTFSFLICEVLPQCMRWQLLPRSALHIGLEKELQPLSLSLLNYIASQSHKGMEYIYCNLGSLEKVYMPQTNGILLISSGFQYSHMRFQNNCASQNYRLFCNNLKL